MESRAPESDEYESEEEQHIGNEIESNDRSSYITDPQEYLDFCLKDKKIKIMDEINPIYEHVFLKDISLHKKGPLEDKIYARVNKYYKNIRRGNTLCQIYQPNQTQNKNQSYNLFFCRRGMKKFYDLEPDYLKVGATLQTNHLLMRKRIFECLEGELEEPGATYHLYGLFKENGQHCQISYVKELDSWLFASKNVAILAKKPSDLKQYYHKERFYWAKLIGEEFFNILKSMSKEKTQQFKKDIQGFTLLGEHCGNEQHQHITKYDKVQIIFYGLVKNTGFDHCQPVEQCRAFLHKYDLKMSTCREKKNLADKNSILASMYEMLREVAQGTMAVSGEGSVMYIVCQREGKQRTVGMCKLKTCQYLIYRRLREMLKLNVARKGSTANSFEKYKYDIESLVNHYFKPPKSLDFYFQVAQKAFKQCGVNGQISQTYLRYKFVDFIAQFEAQQANKASTIGHTKHIAKRIIIICLPRLSSALQKYCKSQGYQLDSMYRPGNKPLTKTVVHIMYMIPRLPQKLQENCQIIIPEYTENDIAECVKQLQECKDLTKSQLITFIKSEDKYKSVKMLHQKIQNFRKTCTQNQINFKTAPFTEEGLIKTVQKICQDSGQTKDKKLTTETKKWKNFILPLLISGSGKSTLAKELTSKQSQQFEWKVIDSDAMRRQLMDKKQEIDIDTEASNQIFKQTGGEALQMFNAELLKQALEEPKSKSQCLYVDRIFSPYNIERTIDALLSLEKDNIKVYILTQTISPVKLNDKTYPYSLNYLLTCLKRCIERPDHKTMPSSPYLIAKILIKFYQMMANFSLKPLLQKYKQNIHFIQMPLIEDNQKNTLVNQQLKKKVQECLTQVEPGHEAKESDSFIELVEALYKYFDSKEEPETLDRYTKLATVLEKEIVNKESMQ